MITVAIRTTEYTHPDPVIDLKAPKIGDAIAWFSEDHVWSDAYSWPKALIFKIDTNDFSEVKHLFEPIYHDPFSESPLVKQFRNYKFDYDTKIPEADLDAIKASEAWDVRPILKTDFKLRNLV